MTGQTPAETTDNDEQRTGDVAPDPSQAIALSLLAVVIALVAVITVMLVISI